MNISTDIEAVYTTLRFSPESNVGEYEVRALESNDEQDAESFYLLLA